jgi:hypothetical protein
MKPEDRIVIVGGYIAGQGYEGARRYQHNRCGEARG